MDTRNLLLLVLTALAACAIYTTSIAQPIDLTDAVPVVPDAGEVDVEAGDDDSAEPDHVADIVEEVGGLPGVVEEIKEAKGDKTAMFMAISALIAIALKVLLSLLKLTGAAIFKNSTFLKIVPLVLGVLIYLFADFAAGVVWYEALIVAAGGPGAILFNEVWELLPILQDAKE
jgi:hypothetical protein